MAFIQSQDFFSGAQSALDGIMAASVPRCRLIVILGPTAVGKTALSLDLAERLHTEIISGDSQLVYRGFDIGTAKPTVEERRGIPHHLIDICDPDEQFSVTDFVDLASEKIKELNSRGQIPILAGGTGLYVKALLEGYEFNETSRHEDFRQEMEQLARERGQAYVHGLLEALDPAAAERLHEHNFRRVVRALEVARFGGEHISEQRAAAGDGSGLVYDALVIGLCRERAALYDRINRRVEHMFASGLEQEVAGLMASGVTPDMPAMKGIGYRETAQVVQGKMEREAAIASIQQSTRHFAKRQLTWYRRMPYIEWLDAAQPPEQLLQAVMRLVDAFVNRTSPLER